MADQLGTRKDERLREKEAKLATEVRALVITDIMSTPSGRAYIWDLLAQCRIFHQTFTPNPLVTAFNEGARSVGLAILGDILTSCPDSYVLAQRESHVRSAAATERRSSPIHVGGDSGSIPDPGLGSEADGTGSPEDLDRGQDGHVYNGGGQVPIGYDLNDEVRRRHQDN